MTEPTAEQDEIARQIVDAAFQVHSTLGPGLLESVYEQGMVYELGLRGLPHRRQVQLPITYKTVELDSYFRLDTVVAEAVVVELKAVEKLLPVHGAQLLTYLKLSGYPLGLLINFNVPLVKDGIRRIIRSA